MTGAADVLNKKLDVMYTTPNCDTVSAHVPLNEYNMPEGGATKNDTRRVSKLACVVNCCTDGETHTPPTQHVVIWISNVA